MTIPPVSRQRFAELLQRLANSAGFSYATIVLLQLKVVWAVWNFRDLTSGDTSSYFVNAYRWFHQGSTPIAWSPLYISFYASLQHLSSDAFVVTTLHRFLIVMALALLILAVMRRLLPVDLAWLLTAWWVALPIDFDAMYEVHLFAVIPVMLAVWLIVANNGPWGRGGALAIMIATSLLMRNELLLAAGALAALLLGAAIWNVRFASVRRWPSSRQALAYAVPLSCAALLVLFYYLHASDAKNLGAVLERKHTLNICQTYAFGYQQRHSDFDKSAWTECQALMTRVYGRPEPSLKQAFAANPRAMMEHLLWNLSLAPNGLQVLLFNVTSGSYTPDYEPVQKSWAALPCSCALLIVFLAGGIRLARTWKSWWDDWLKDRAWAWLLLVTVACVTVGVMITQRPRPSYMLTFGVLLRAVTGMLLFVLVARSRWYKRLLLAFPVVVVLLILFVPSYYATHYAGRSRGLLRDYERLAEYGPIFRESGTELITAGFGGELCNYVGIDRCEGLDYPALRAEVGPGNPWSRVLANHGATLLYADETILNDPVGQDLVREVESLGWQTYALHNGQSQSWVLLGKAKRAVARIPALAGAPEMESQSDVIPVVGDWTGDGTSKTGTFLDGQWYLAAGGASSSTRMGWGQAGDIPVVGDWNGDGRAKIGVFRRGVWFLDLDGSHLLTPSKIIQWGKPGDIPVLGDWNHDGKTKIGVVRSGTWILDRDGSHQPVGKK